MKPAVALCDRELAEEVDKLLSATSTSCNKPHYNLPSIEQCGDGTCESSATTYLPSMMTLMFAWVMMLLTKPLLT